MAVKGRVKNVSESKAIDSNTAEREKKRKVLEMRYLEMFSNYPDVVNDIRRFVRYDSVIFDDSSSRRTDYFLGMRDLFVYLLHFLLFNFLSINIS
jgi:hypothetical protein